MLYLVKVEASCANCGWEPPTVTATPLPALLAAAPSLGDWWSTPTKIDWIYPFRHAITFSHRFMCNGAAARAIPKNRRMHGRFNNNG